MNNKNNELDIIVDGGNIVYEKHEENEQTEDSHTESHTESQNKKNEEQPVIKPINKCKLCYFWSAFTIYFIIMVAALTCYFIFLVPGKKEDANNCMNAISDILTKVNVTACDGRYVDCQYEVNNKNITCQVEYNEPQTCIFPNNELYIYTSKDNKHCTSYKDKTSNGSCREPLILFYVLSIWLLCGGCLAAFIHTFYCEYKKL